MEGMIPGISQCQFDSKTAAENNLPWVEKYRPKTLEELVSVDHVVASCMIWSGAMPHLLLYGPPGSGKTSTALALISTVYKGSIHRSCVLELNASDDRGIGVVRNDIITFAGTSSFFGSSYKFVILDEADAMTNDAQNALKRVVEKFSKNVRFCFICNYLSGIIPAIQSRCTRFRFAPLSSDQIKNRLHTIILNENVPATDEAVDTIVRLSRGDMRKCLNILQSTFVSHRNVTEENIYLTTGHPSRQDIDQIIHYLMHNGLTDSFQKIKSIKIEKGIALQDILSEIHVALSGNNFLSRPQLVYIYIKMAEIEKRVADSINEHIHLAALVSAFIQARTL